MESYPPNLHQAQGINHLNRVLGYAPFVVEDGVAVVHLTPEDWGVVSDTLFSNGNASRDAPGVDTRNQSEKREQDDRPHDGRYDD